MLMSLGIADTCLTRTTDKEMFDFFPAKADKAGNVYTKV